jgi:peptidoglycan glycosyltransferase
VATVLRLRAEGARTLVRDARGRLLGAVDEAGRLALADPDAASWVPTEALAAAASGHVGPAGLRTSLDEGLSRLALEALGTQRGTIVLLDAATGAVLAAVSDDRTRAENDGAAAWTQHREPASIAKLITTTAALRAGLDPDAEIAGMTCAGHATYGRGQLWCSLPGGPLAGLGHALAISCNLAFANLGMKLGAGRLLEEYQLYGYRPAARAEGGARILKPPEGDRELADLAVGLEATDMTPVHGARMAAVFVQGRLPTAHLLAASDGALGRTPRAIPVEAGLQVADPRWLPLLTRAMEAVTGPGGTAGGLDPPGFQVAMKTGTAAAPGAGYHVNYIGVGPLPRPRIAFCVRLTHGGSSPDVNRRARQVLAALLASLQAS